MLTGQSSVILWQDVIKSAEQRCAITLNADLEVYLVGLLMRYLNKPELAHRIIATAFLQALEAKKQQNRVSLQAVGDECLIFAGLFPQAAERKLIKINYFVDIGRSAYALISATHTDLFGSLALQFVVLMDVLQSIRGSDLLPHEAFEQWQQVGSQRALKMMQEYASLGIIPIKKLS